MDVLCLMFESSRRGYLLTNGHPWSLQEIANAIRGDNATNLAYLKELVHNGVMKSTKKGHRTNPGHSAQQPCYFNARMVLDERQREQWRSEKRRQRVDNKHSDSGHHSGRSPAVLHSSSSDLNTKTPLPPATAGDESVFVWQRETIAVRMGRHKRLPDLKSFGGAQAKYVVDFLNQRGFPARIVPPQ
jgi:hypothetical protein